MNCVICSERWGSDTLRWGETPGEPGLRWREALCRFPDFLGTDGAVPSNQRAAREDARPTDFFWLNCTTASAGGGMRH
jgi:hypothetical protein